MILRIKVSRNDFNAATSDGWVDGLVQGREGLYTYVELGKEQEYIPKPTDDPKTEYRMFRGCSVFFATSLKRLAEGYYEAEESNVTVIIYC
ncbi:MAG: hypothetical protein KME30_28985 [Iphinoe sp. HA4291-MV1]|jgi:hypothetical protein|nr:hypothetical protein [Iphinoe sp. HA4291-MV1]